MEFLKLRGIVLKEIAVSEYKRHIILFCKGKGKVVVSCTISKNKKIFSSTSCQILSYNDFIIYEKNGFYNIHSLDVITSFPKIQSDLKSVAFSMLILEATSNLIFEDLQNDKLLKFLLLSLSKITDANKEPRLVCYTYLFKALEILDFFSQIDHCFLCGADLENNAYYEKSADSFVCENCKSMHSMYIFPSTFKAFKFVFYNNDVDIFKFNLSEDVLEQFCFICLKLVQKELVYPLKTLEFSNSFK